MTYWYAVTNFSKQYARLMGLLLCLALATMQSAHAQVTLRIEPNEPEVTSCLAFGAGPGAGREGVDGGAEGFLGTSPFMGFIYRNIPPFDLAAGDLLSFDLGKENDFDVEIDIFIAATTENGGLTEAEPFTKIVSNTQTPLNPRGDDIIGNYEMEFTVEAPYSFPGGGLILRFSNGSDAYREDLTCDDSQVGVVAKESDGSGYFANAFWSDRDGLAPFEPFVSGLRTELIGGFQITELGGPDRIMLSNDLLDDEGEQAFDVLPGDTVYYRATIRNPQITDASGIEVVLTPSDQVDLTPGVAPDTVKAFIEPGSSEIEVPFVGGEITWGPVSLASGEWQSIIFEMLVLAGNPDLKLVNSAMVNAIDAPFIGNNAVTLETSFARLELTGRISSDFGTQLQRISPGETVHYRVDVENPYDIDAESVEVVTTLSDAVDFVEADTIPDGISSTGPDVNGNMTWDVGTVPAGDFAQIDITFELPDSTPELQITNSAIISAIDAPFVAGNETVSETPIDRVLTLELIAIDENGDETTTVVAGTELDYRLTVSNEGALEAEGLEIGFELNEELELVDASDDLVEDVDLPNVYYWSVGMLDGDSEVVLDVTVYVPILLEPESVVQTVSLVSEIDYPFSDGDAVSWGVAVEENPNPRIIILNSGALNADGNETTTVVAGQEFVYRVTVKNTDELDATSVEISVTLPDELELVEFMSTPDAVVAPDPEDPALLIWSVDALNSGAEAGLDVTMHVPVMTESGLVVPFRADMTDVDGPFLLSEESETDTEFEISSLAQDLLDQAGSGNCFIATAAYGSYLEPDVVVLRRFRDRALLTNDYGRQFVAWYYRVSPPIADYIAAHAPLRVLVRGLIAPLVYTLKYPGMALLLLAFTSVAALGYGLRQRAGALQGECA